MKVILRSDITDLGKKGDIIDVADGFARNYLVPEGLAFKASKGAESQAKAMRRSRDVRDAAERGAAEEIARQLVPKTIHIASRAGGAGKLFGSVTAQDVVDAVKTQTNLEIDRRKIHIDEAIREVGTHRVTAKLHADVEFPITLEVVAAVTA